jgi:ribosome-binding protein aMBF1 (putative translation factor)
MARTPQEKILTGLKIRQHRQEAGWSFEEMSRKFGHKIYIVEYCREYRVFT